MSSLKWKVIIECTQINIQLSGTKPTPHEAIRIQHYDFMERKFSDSGPYLLFEPLADAHAILEDILNHHDMTYVTLALKGPEAQLAFVEEMERQWDENEKSGFDAQIFKQIKDQSK